MRSRYKVYIIDEAHMVSTQGFNALLKLVEEPPPHLQFIFATTEPDKVLATIRSRTHHYPFRLIPPRLLSAYLSRAVREEEGVPIEPAALPLVVRAGGGSARDTLSVLDQLLGGAGAGRGDLRAGHRPARLHRPTRCSTRWSTRSPPATAPRSSGWSTRSSRPAGPAPLHRGPAAPAARPGDRRRGARRPATGLIDVPEDQGERLVAQAARFGAPTSAGPPTWSPPASPRCAAPPPRACCSS